VTVGPYLSDMGDANTLLRGSRGCRVPRCSVLGKYTVYNADTVPSRKKL